jgi:2-hydroxychromene-2-carboxylate isomerase
MASEPVTRAGGQDSHIRNAEFRALYARAFAEFGIRALWNMEQIKEPTDEDALAVARQLRIEGNLAARRLAEQIEEFAHANH